MGSIFTQDTAVSKKTYILAFTSYQGTAGRLPEKIYTIKKPESRSLENWINKNYQYAFVDFKELNNSADIKSAPFYMSGATKGNRYHDSQLGEWNKIYDGFFFIRNMFACAR